MKMKKNMRQFFVKNGIPLNDVVSTNGGHMKVIVNNTPVFFSGSPSDYNAFHAMQRDLNRAKKKA
jgi:hypothetical protein